MQTETINISGIEVGATRRAIDQSNVDRLKDSIQLIGLQTPITVMAVPDGPNTRMILVAGAHRLEALRQLGEEDVDAIVMEGDQDAADLWEIDENLARGELDPSDESTLHARREEILFRRGEVSRAGGDRRSNGQNVHLKPSYATRAAADFGVDPRSIRRALARGKAIDPDVLKEITGTDLDKGVILDEIAKAPVEQQRDKVQEIRARRARPESPPQAPLNDLEAKNKQVNSLIRAWNKAGPEARDEFRAYIDRPVFDATRSGRTA